MENKVFSIDRFNMLCRFYWPAMRRQLFWSGIVLVFCYVVSLCALEFAVHTESEGKKGLLIMVVGGLSAVVSFVYYLGPLLFASCRQRLVATTLPASWQEKSLLFLGWCVVFFPLFLAVVWYACVGIASMFSDYASIYAALAHHALEDVPGVFQNLTGKFNLVNIFTSLSVMSCAAWGVCYCRHNRMAMGVVGALVGTVISSVLSMGFALLAMLDTDFFRGLRDGLAVKPEDFPLQLVEAFQHWLPMLNVVVIVFSLSVLSLCVYKIKTRQN